MLCRQKRIRACTTLSLPLPVCWWKVGLAVTRWKDTRIFLHLVYVFVRVVFDYPHKSQWRQCNTCTSLRVQDNWPSAAAAAISHWLSRVSETSALQSVCCYCCSQWWVRTFVIQIITAVVWRQFLGCSSYVASFKRPCEVCVQRGQLTPSFPVELRNVFDPYVLCIN